MLQSRDGVIDPCARRRHQPARAGHAGRQGDEHARGRRRQRHRPHGRQRERRDRRGDRRGLTGPVKRSEDGAHNRPRPMRRVETGPGRRCPPALFLAYRHPFSFAVRTWWAPRPASGRWDRVRTTRHRHAQGATACCHTSSSTTRSSLDARMDGLDVDMGRFYTLAGTWHEDCTLVGSETLLAGMPELGEAAVPVALEPGDAGHSGAGASPHAPLLAAVDSRGRLPGLSRLRDQPYWSDVIGALRGADAGGASRPAEGRRRRHDRHWGRARRPAPRARDARGRARRQDGAGGRRRGAHRGAGARRARQRGQRGRRTPPRRGESHRWLVRAPDAGPGDAVALKLRGIERLDDDALWLRYDVVPR